MIHLLSLRPYFFPEKDKIKYYQKAVKNQNRKLIQISSHQQGEDKFLVYRPCHQTAYGLKQNKWRLSSEKSFPIKNSYQSISEEEYNQLEKTVITTCWHNGTAHFFKESKKYLDAANESAKYESEQTPDGGLSFSGDYLGAVRHIIHVLSQSTTKGFKTLIWFPMKPEQTLVVRYQFTDKDWQQKEFGKSVNQTQSAIEFYNSIDLSTESMKYLSPSYAQR